MNNKYLLHSHAPDNSWFHFRKDLNSVMESFSIIYAHDGTVFMTGDYGCLSWRREWFSGRNDYGFPSEATFIGYFSEKVVRAEQDQKIRTWKKSIAIQEIQDAIVQHQEDDEDDDYVVALESILEDMELFEDYGEQGRYQLIEAFQHAECRLEPDEFYNFGECYTDMFIFKFKMLCSVSDQILEVVNKGKVIA